MNNIIDPFDETAVVSEAQTSVSIAPKFDELAVFGNLDSKADAIFQYLGEKYSYAESYTIAYAWCELFDRLKKQLIGKAVNSTNAKTVDITLGGKVVAMLTERNLPAKWEYNDPILARMEAQLDQLKADVKDRQAMSQKLKKEIADTETGEVIKPATKKETGSTVAVKLTEGV